MYKPKNHHERIIQRIKISAGQLKKVISMVENGEYCIDVIHQLQAVQKALREIDHAILENHLKTCTTKALRKGNSKTAITEIMQILKKW